MISIIDYDAGNLRSVSNALKAVEVDFNIASSADDLKGSSGIILPGVGAAPGAMASLIDRGLAEPLKKWDRPLLGICLGMQLMFEISEEGNTECLGRIRGTVKKFSSHASRVPHMGWNSVEFNSQDHLWKSVDRSYFYFAHSYYVPLCETTSGESESGIRFSSAVQAGNMFGFQFHPEKSGPDGLYLLRLFANICESFQR